MSILALWPTSLGRIIVFLGISGSVLTAGNLPVVFPLICLVALSLSPLQRLCALLGCLFWISAVVLAPLAVWVFRSLVILDIVIFPLAVFTVFLWPLSFDLGGYYVHQRFIVFYLYPFSST